MAKDNQNIVKAVIEFIVGLACLPIAAGYAVLTSADTNVAAITGLNLVITLGVLVVGLALVYNSVKKML